MTIVYVKTRVWWIVESEDDGELVGNLKVNDYTRSYDYEYFLELDGYDQIIGGEWYGDSRQYHPDFAYMIVPERGQSQDFFVAGIKYSHVRELAAISASVYC